MKKAETLNNKFKIGNTVSYIAEYDIVLKRKRIETGVLLEIRNSPSRLNGLAYYVKKQNKMCSFFDEKQLNPSPLPIFDADGWCREFEKIATYLHEADTDDAYVLVCLQGYKTPLPAMYSEIGDSDCKSTYELLAIDIVKDDTITVDKNNFIAWQPVPEISIKGNKS